MLERKLAWKTMASKAVRSAGLSRLGQAEDPVSPGRQYGNDCVEYTATGCGAVARHEKPIELMPFRAPLAGDNSNALEIGPHAGDGGTANAGPGTVTSRIEAALKKTRAEFIAKLADYHVILDHVADHIASKAPTDKALEDAMHIAHRISGVAKTLGFPELGRVAHLAQSEILAYNADRSVPELFEISIARVFELTDLVEGICTNHETPIT